jgi:ATPase subunit of ABC transporter with duplicated ATPase domains
MISISNLGKSYGGRTLFEGVSLQLNQGARYGLVGANGSGKTTLLRILAGDESASEGSFVFGATARVGVLRQDRFLEDDKIIRDLAMMGEAKVWQALKERARIVDHGEGDPTRLADLEDTLAHFDGYTLEARATSVLEGLGIPAAEQLLPLSTLSGGFKLRVLLAQVLVGGPEALLLDEPTNHLDILSIRWLEKFLAAYRGVAVVISHDRRFLDHVATHILDVDYGTILPYTGSYSAFVEQKKAVRAQKEDEIARAEKIIAHKRAFVERFGAKASKAKQAQSRLKQIDRIEVAELAESSRRSPLFRFEPDRPSGKDVLEVAGLCKAYGEHQVLRDLSFLIRRGEKVAVIGPNGLGKSTLLKIVTDHVAPTSGQVTVGHEVRIGYFAQDHHELLRNAELTPVDYLWEACPGEGSAFVRGQLGRVLFSGDDVVKPIGSLSGGEAARLIFGRLAVERPNLLVLDEPTNHLDVESIEALAEALRAYAGTLLFVSHDRWFVSELATRIIELTPTGPRDFPGTFAEYLARSGDDHLDADAVLERAPKVPVRRSPDKSGSWEEQKRERNRIAALPGRRDKVLAAIDVAESRKRAIAALYEDPSFYQRTPRDQIDQLVDESAALDRQIEALVADWEALEAEIAATSGG